MLLKKMSQGGASKLNLLEMSMGENANDGYWTSTPERFHESFTLQKFLTSEEDVISQITSNDSSAKAKSVCVKYIGTYWMAGPPETSDKSVQTENKLRELHRSAIPIRSSFPLGNNLFEGYVFLVARPFYRFTQAEMEHALKYHGGMVTKNHREFTNFSITYNKICIIGELCYYHQYINKEALRKKLQHCVCTKLHYTWILDSLLNYNLVPMDNYYFDMNEDKK